MNKYFIIILILFSSYSFTQVDIDTFEVDYIRTKFSYNPKTKKKAIYEVTTKYKSGLYKTVGNGRFSIRDFDIPFPHNMFQGKTYISFNEWRKRYYYYNKNNKLDSLRIDYSNSVIKDTTITFKKKRIKRKNQKLIYKDGLLIKNLNSNESYEYDNKRRLYKLTLNKSDYIIFIYNNKNQLIISERHRKNKNKKSIDKSEYIYSNRNLLRINSYTITNKNKIPKPWASYLYEYKHF